MDSQNPEFNSYFTAEPSRRKQTARRSVGPPINPRSGRSSGFPSTTLGSSEPVRPRQTARRGRRVSSYRGVGRDSSSSVPVSQPSESSEPVRKKQTARPGGGVPARSPAGRGGSSSSYFEFSDSPPLVPPEPVRKKQTARRSGGYPQADGSLRGSPDTDTEHPYYGRYQIRTTSLSMPIPPCSPRPYKTSVYLALPSRGDTARIDLNFLDATVRILDSEPRSASRGVGGWYTGFLWWSFEAEGRGWLLFEPDETYGTRVSGMLEVVKDFRSEQDLEGLTVGFNGEMWHKEDPWIQETWEKACVPWEEHNRHSSDSGSINVL